MSSLDCSLDPALPGKAMEDESCPRDGGEKVQYYMQVSAKEGQLLSNVLAKQRYVPVHQLVQQGVGCGFDSQWVHITTEWLENLYCKLENLDNTVI